MPSGYHLVRTYKRYASQRRNNKAIMEVIMTMVIWNNNIPEVRKALGFTVGVSFILLLSACVNVGHDFASSKVYDNHIGKTTQAEIVAMFGQPWRVGLNDGKLRWTYGSYHYSAFGETRTKDLVVQFDAKNIVTSYTFNTTDAAEIRKPQGSGQE
jgi:hypothetical protein